MTEHDGQRREQEEQARLQALRTCQTLTMVALIGAPVSLIVGGVLMSVAALVCACIAYARLAKLAGPEEEAGSIERTLRTQSRIALVASAVACALNAVAFAYAFGAVAEAIRSGDVSGLFESVGASGASGASSSASIWD